jgi:hypothetical protein
MRGSGFLAAAGLIFLLSVKTAWTFIFAKIYTVAVIVLEALI